ncbi:hypothetical protein [Candidatus Poriferisodalis sp.]|uniref:hypothetical protein n=1 Tax=Candidatus Poriferisodalis sp. TaxID=3101277 RepID=UPI003B520810
MLVAAGSPLAVCHCPALVGSAFEAVMKSRGSDREQTVETFVDQWAGVCDGELPEPSGEAMPWECVHGSRHVSLFGPMG